MQFFVRNFFCSDPIPDEYKRQFFSVHNFLWHHYANFHHDNPERRLCKEIRWSILAKSNVTLQLAKSNFTKQTPTQTHLVCKLHNARDNTAFSCAKEDLVQQL